VGTRSHLPKPVKEVSFLLAEIFPGAQAGLSVIAIDNSPIRLALARHNATIYGVVDRIEFILGDYLSFARSQVTTSVGSQRKIDVVFLSPPWGGPSYLSGVSYSTNVVDDDEVHPEFHLSDIKPIHGKDLFKLSKNITPNIAYFLPRNTNLEEISELACIGGGGAGKGQSEVVEVEEEWMGKKLKALTCYYGGLAQGQQHLF
jgi:trimethylguanosine synthase